jgi:hypothetical protein
MWRTSAGNKMAMRSIRMTWELNLFERLSSIRPLTSPFFNF